MLAEQLKAVPVQTVGPVPIASHLYAKVSPGQTHPLGNPTSTNLVSTIFYTMYNIIHKEILCTKHVSYVRVGFMLPNELITVLYTQAINVLHIGA